MDIKMWIKIAVLLFVLYAFGTVDGRGGGRGGGGRSSGGSRGSSRSSGSRAAMSRYRGPTYRAGSWKTAAAAGTLYGVASYQRRRLYLSNPSREPKVCFNADNLRNGTYGYFICPEPDQADDHIYCCGEEGLQKCCTYDDYKHEQKVKAIVGGVIGGVVAVAAAVGVTIFCVVRNNQRKRAGCRNGRSTGVVVAKQGTTQVTTTVISPPAYTNNAYSNPSDFGVSSSVYNTIPENNGSAYPTQNGEPPKYGFKDGADGLPYSSTPYPPASGGPMQPDAPPPPYTTTI